MRPFFGSAAENLLAASDFSSLLNLCTAVFFFKLQKRSCFSLSWFWVLHFFFSACTVDFTSCTAHTGTVVTAYETRSLLRPELLSSAIALAVVTQPWVELITVATSVLPLDRLILLPRYSWPACASFFFGTPPRSLPVLRLDLAYLGYELCYPACHADKCKRSCHQICVATAPTAHMCLINCLRLWVRLFSFVLMKPTCKHATEKLHAGCLKTFVALYFYILWLQE